jgi:hypothetical protein
MSILHNDVIINADQQSTQYVEQTGHRCINIVIAVTASVYSKKHDSIDVVDMGIAQFNLLHHDHLQLHNQQLYTLHQV